MITLGMCGGVGLAIAGQRLAGSAAAALVRVPSACSTVLEVTTPGTYNLYVEHRATLAAGQPTCHGRTEVDGAVSPAPPAVVVRAAGERPTQPAGGETYEVSHAGHRYAGRRFATVEISASGPITLTTAGAAGDQLFIAAGLAENSPNEVRLAMRRWSYLAGALALPGLFLLARSFRRRAPAPPATSAPVWLPPSAPSIPNPPR